MRGHTYSLYARTARTYRFVACEGSVISASPSSGPIITQLPGQVFKSSQSGASCSLYTFVATQNNTILDYTLCYTTASGAAFTHSLIFNNGDLGFICSATAVNLVSGTYTDFNFKTQPESPCDCGTNLTTTTTTITTSTTTILSLTQSWYLQRDVCCALTPNSYTYANLNIITYNLSSLISGNYIPLETGPGDFYCYRLRNPVGYTSSYSAPFNGSQIYQNCTDCGTAGYPVIFGTPGCPSTTTTTTTLSPFNPNPGGVSNCPCGQFQCMHYVVEGQADTSIRWRECTQSIGTPGAIRNFNFYYFYEIETIEFCSCSDAVEIVSIAGGQIVINGITYNNLGQIPTSSTLCTRKDDNCKSTHIELGEEFNNLTRPIKVDFDPCFEPSGGWGGYPRVTMWPTTNGLTFSGLPVPSPVWAPLPQSGTIFGRKTHVYTICAKNNSPGILPDDFSNWIGPTISYWDEDNASWEIPVRATTAPPETAEYYAWESCNGATCSCVNLGSCTTTTTTLIPCPNCRPTVIGASGSGYTQILYEGCDTLQRNLINIKNEYLFRGVTTSICACERCRQVRIWPTGDGGLLSYKHCCDPPISAAGRIPPTWHESSIDLISRTCKSFTLKNTLSLTTFQYVDCRDSKIKYSVAETIKEPTICASTVSYFSGDLNFTITTGANCGTASAELCISRDHYGPTFFGDATDNGFTFSNIGSCSCITSDNRYNPYMYNSRLWNNPLSVRGPSIEWLFITVSSMAATCSDKTISPNLPQTGGIPGCCNCVVYEMSLNAGDIINYKPCATNRDYSNTILNVQAPQISLPGTTAAAGSFSYRIQASGFYDIGSMSIVINHNNLVVYTASILPSPLTVGGQLSVLGTFSRFSWSGPSGFFQGTTGPVDILNFTFAMTGPQGAARIEIYTSSTGGFYSFSNFRSTAGLTMSPNYYDGWISFSGFGLPGSQKNSTPPNWPTFP